MCSRPVIWLFAFLCVAHVPEPCMCLLMCRGRVGLSSGTGECYIGWGAVLVCFWILHAGRVHALGWSLGECGFMDMPRVCYMRVWRKGRRVLGLHLCRVLSNCGSAWVFWRVVCRMRLSVYSRGMGIWRHIRWGYALVVFRRDMLGLYMWGRGEVCVCWRDEVLCFYKGVGDVHFLV